MSLIFVSYRRRDSRWETGRLCDRLQQHFGNEAVFRDIASIEAGADFTETIIAKVQAASVVLVMIGPRWIELWGEDGRTGFDRPDDYVRVEIATAIRLRIPIIPILVGGARMPTAAELPDSIDPLATRQAHELTDERWQYDTDRLIRQLETFARPAVARNGTGASSGALRPVLLSLAGYGPALADLLLHPRRRLIAIVRQRHRGLDAAVFFTVSHLIGSWLFVFEEAVTSVPRFVLTGVPIGAFFLVVLVVPLDLSARLARVRTDVGTMVVMLATIQSVFFLIAAAGVAVMWAGLVATDPDFATMMRRFVADNVTLEQRFAEFTSALQARIGRLFVGAFVVSILIWLFAAGWALVASTAFRDVWRITRLRAAAVLVTFCVSVGAAVALVAYVALSIS